MSIEELMTNGTRSERRSAMKENKSFKPKNKRAASMKPLKGKTKKEGANNDCD